MRDFAILRRVPLADVYPAKHTDSVSRVDLQSYLTDGKGFSKLGCSF